MHLRLLAGNLMKKNIPILKALELEGLDRAWLSACVDCFGASIHELGAATAASDGWCVHTIFAYRLMY
jgi:hypothetical protein